MDNQQSKMYIREQYDVYAFFNNNHFDTNILSRSRNVLATAFNQHDKLPRMIAVILDLDMMHFIDHDIFGISLEAGSLQDWLVAEFHKLVKARFDQLPSKCKRVGVLPHIIWIGAPQHSHFLTRRMNSGSNTIMDWKKFYRSHIRI